MTTSVRARRLLLTLHVLGSVGWFGAILAFLALAITGVASSDAGTVRAVYVAMDPVGSFALVPLARVSLLTGLVQSCVSPWGLLRHYWVIVKLVLNLLALAVLLLYTRTLSDLREQAGAVGFRADDLGGPRFSPLVHAVLALVLLAVATVLAVFKPRGTTRFAARRR